MEEDEAENDDAGDEWPAWNPAIFVPDNAMIPQHPAVPQDHIDLSLSGSSMCFLCGEGPDISLEDVLGINIIDDASSSAIEVRNSQMEDQACFAAAQSHCANLLIHNSNSLPGAAFTRATTDEGSIVINKEAIQSMLAALPHSAPLPSTGMEIVPWKPVPAAIAWPDAIASRQVAKSQVQDYSVIILPDPRDVQGPVDSSPMDFEFQAEHMQPSPPTAVG